MKINVSLYIIAFLMSFGAFAQVDRSKMPEPGPAPKISLEKPKEFKLKNGMTVMVVENHKLPRVSYSLDIDNRPIANGKKAGVESLIGSMMGNGTTNIPKDEFNEEVDFLGARINFGSSGAFASGLSKYSERILELMADAAINPLLTEEEFKKEQAKLIDGLKTQEKSVEAVSDRVGSALSYGKNHPYGEFTTQETVNNVAFGDAVSYYESYFNPNNAYLVVAGDIDYKTIKSQIENYFGKWEKTVGISYTVPEAAPNVQYTQINFIDMPNAVQSDVMVTNNVDLKMKDDDYQAALITNYILGGGSDGYLYQNLRESKGYTYGSYSNIGSNKYGNARFTATAQVRNEVTDSSVVELLNEVKRLKTEPVNAETLKLAKAKYVGNFVMALESPQTIARYALNIKQNDLPEDFYTTYLQKINAVTADDVMRVANKYLKTDNARIIVVGKGSEVLDNLEKTGIPIMYFDAYANSVDKPNYEVEMPADMDANKVLEAYIKAVGGKEELEKVNSVYMTAEAEFQPGMMLNLTSKTTNKTQSLTEVNAMGQTVMKSVVNGDTGYMMMQGQRKDLSAEELTTYKMESTPFPELNLLDSDVKLEKIENVDGANAYKINVSESKSIFYNMDTGLKIKQVETTPQGMSVQYFSDYQNVGNIKFPFKMIQESGPQKFDFTVKEIKVNEGVSDADFN